MWWKKITFHNFFLASGILSILSIIGIIAVKNFLPPVVPLFFGKPSGEDQLASYWMLFLIPAVSILINAINLFINMSSKDVFVRKILAVSSFVIAFMAATTLVKIILLVGFF